MSFRIVAYVTLALLVLLALNSLTDRTEGINEQRERQAVQDARRWHKGFVSVADSAKRATVVAQKAVAKSKALRDSVRVVSDSLLAVVTSDAGKVPHVDTVPVPQIVVRRLVADSVAIEQLTQLTAIQRNAITVADSTIATYERALKASQKAATCRIAGLLPCPSRRATALLTAGAILAAKIALGGTL